MFNKIIACVFVFASFAFAPTVSYAACQPGQHDQSSCTSGEGASYLYGAQIGGPGVDPDIPEMPFAGGGGTAYNESRVRNSGADGYLSDDQAGIPLALILIGGIVAVLVVVKATRGRK